MFRWYRNSTRCYAYMTDVSIGAEHRSQQDWETVVEQAFRKSRWFTRGWTLQELIAPASLEFFSVEGNRIGDRASLKQQICEITGIATDALSGKPLSQFSVDERLSWAEKRRTTREEDKAYSLLGIFDV